MTLRLSLLSRALSPYWVPCPFSIGPTSLGPLSLVPLWSRVTCPLLGPLSRGPKVGEASTRANNKIEQASDIQEA